MRGTNTFQRSVLCGLKRRINPVYGILVCSLLIAVSACTNVEELPTIHQVDPDLAAYFDQFKSAANKHNCTTQLNTYCRVICEKTGDLYMGYADKANHIIAINAHYLNYPIMMEFIMLHECGHYFFDMKHGDNYIMADGLSTDIVREYMQNREYYLKQFFSTANNERSGSGSSQEQDMNMSTEVRCSLAK